MDVMPITIPPTRPNGVTVEVNALGQDLLWQYARRLREAGNVGGFADNLEAALCRAGFAAPADDSLRRQVAEQCRAVRHLARVLCDLHEEYERLILAGAVDPALDAIGARTAHQIEALSATLNSTAADPGSDRNTWLYPIVAEAHRRWPAPGSAAGA